MKLKLLALFLCLFTYYGFADNYYYEYRVMFTNDIYIPTVLYSTDSEHSGTLPDDLTVENANFYWFLTGTVAIASLENHYDSVFSIVSTNSSGDDVPWITNDMPTASIILSSDDDRYDKYRFRVEDYQETPDGPHLGILELKNDFLIDNYTEGYLFSQDTRYPNGFFEDEKTKNVTIPADIDIFKINLDVGVYCVDAVVGVTWDIKPLEITVYEANGNNYGDELGKTNIFNCYGNSGDLDNKHQRVYFAQESAGNVYIKIKPTDTAFQGEYKIRVLKTRPVILVHGIQCYPKESNDLNHGWNSMGHWNDYLPYDVNCYPCKCYNFLWDSEINDLEYNPSENSKIKEIVDCDINKNPSVVQLYNLHNMNVVIIGHSMGGYIVRYALKKKEKKIHKAITLGCPNYGSDVALGPINKLTSWFKETSVHNLHALAPGSNMAWEMHKWGGENKLVCFAGYGAPPRVPDWLGYIRGLYDSDGVVPVSSAFVIGADNAMKLKADHGTVALATYVSQDKYPYDPNPSGLIEAILERIFGNNKGQNRISSRLIIGDNKYNKVYKKVRDYIKP